MGGKNSINEVQLMFYFYITSESLAKRKHARQTELHNSMHR